MRKIGKIALRGIYLAVSVFGIVHELTRAESARWPLIAGYGLVIALTLYVLRFPEQEQEDEPT